MDADIDLAAVIAFALHTEFNHRIPDITVSVSDGIVNAIVLVKAS